MVNTVLSSKKVPSSTAVRSRSKSPSRNTPPLKENELISTEYSKSSMAGESAVTKNGLKKKSGNQFTWQEVAEHNKPDDAWIIYKGKVYDITNWIPEHPGGQDALYLAAGRDCSVVFDTYHKEETKNYLPKYEIGTVTNSELPEFPHEDKFFKDIKGDVRKHFKDTHRDPKNNLWIWVRYFSIFAIIPSCTLLQVYFSNLGLKVGIALAVVQGFFAAMLGLMPMHDASHFSITHNPLVWKILGHTHDFLNGASFLVWNYQHILGHHPYTNIDGADPDIETAENDIRRIKIWQVWRWPYVYQHIYAPLVYGLLAWKTRVQDFTILFGSRKNGSIRVNPPTWNLTALFLLGKLCWFTHRILLPSMFIPITHVLLFSTISDFVTSYWLALTFQANHVVHNVEWPLPDKNNKMKYDWSILQMKTTQDYSHHSWGWTYFTGALNFQVVHHLFPGHHQFYYPEIAKIIQKKCKAEGLNYMHLDNFSQALGSHLGYLRAIGNTKSHAKKVQ